MFIDSKRNARKVIGLLMEANQELKDKKQKEAILAVTDLLDELVVEGRW